MRVAAIVSVATLTVFASPALRAGSSTFEQSRYVSDADWCKDAGGSRDRERFCEVRDLTMQAPSTFEVSTTNGGVAIEGTSRRDIAIHARIVATADTVGNAQALAAKVAIQTSGGRLDADGPRSERGASWSVSYRIEAPSRLNITATSNNGSVGITGIDGTLRVETDNGSLHLTDVAGDVRATTSNGSLQVDLSGNSWAGAGLEATTSNGSVKVNMPRDYNAHLVASTNNGSMRVDRPMMVQGRIGRDIDTNLGRGGATLRLRTSNGSLVINEK
jgi:DUF4097 and DUF4098 domain-containing protein YvlB